MCESSVYLNIGNKEKLVLKDVGFVRPDGDKVIVRNIFGEEKTVEGRIKEINLMAHRIILEAAGDKK